MAEQYKQHVIEQATDAAAGARKHPLPVHHAEAFGGALRAGFA